MAASLAETQQARKNLIADIAHELRTPLTVLQGNLQALMDDVYPLTKAEIAALADETQTLSRLVGDLHDLAQADAGQLSLHVGPTDLGALVTQSTALLADLAQDRALHLATAIEPNLSPVMADPDRLRQVVHNLVLNALRYTPAGGSVAVSATQQTGPNGACVRVAVQDTGPGIAPADLPHVFDRFWRGERSRARAQGGSGLGLAIARQLIEAQGGTIGVDSQPGQGSCFWFMLPAHASSASLLSAS
jgi:two-component system OmpR family sensor kinase/two-component system sensor histidine kinase BaeS